MSVALSLVPKAPTVPSCVDIPPAARLAVYEMGAKMSAVRSSLAGSFTTDVKLAEAERLLAEIEAQAKAARMAIGRRR